MPFRFVILALLFCVGFFITSSVSAQSNFDDSWMWSSGNSDVDLAARPEDLNGLPAPSNIAPLRTVPLMTPEELAAQQAEQERRHAAYLEFRSLLSPEFQDDLDKEVMDWGLRPASDYQNLARQQREYLQRVAQLGADAQGPTVSVVPPGASRGDVVEVDMSSLFCTEEVRELGDQGK